MRRSNSFDWGRLLSFGLPTELDFAADIHDSSHFANNLGVIDPYPLD